MSVRGYQLGIDWSGGGDFTGPYDDVSSWVADDDLVIEVGRETSQAASNIPAGTLAFQLVEKASDPTQRVFTPEAGPIGGRMLPGIAASFSTTDSANNSVTLLTGVLDSFEYDDEAGTLSGSIRDSWGTPSAEQLSTPVYQGMRTGDLISIVLDAIGWTGGRDLDPGATTVAYWWEEGTDAATAIQKLVDSEGVPAIAYVYAGTFYFRDRHHRLLYTASTTSQATYSVRYPPGSGGAGELKILSGGFVYQHGRSNIVNTATFQVEEKVGGTETAVWTTDSPLNVAAGATISLTINASTGFINAATPTPATMFDDNGAPIDGDYTLASGDIASISLSRTSGASTTLTIVGGASDALFTYLQVRATPIVTGQTVTVTAQSPTVTSNSRVLSWPGSLPWCNRYDAEAIADRIVAQYATARVLLTFAIDTDLGSAYEDEFAERRVSDRITVINNRLGINGDFHIEKVKRVVRGLGKQGAQLIITAEAAPSVGAVNPFTFDVAGKGFDQGQFDVPGIDNGSTVFRFDVAGQGFDQGRFAT